MRSLTTKRHQKLFCRVLLVALLFSLPIGARIPSTGAQQTSQDANALLLLSETQNETNHQQALQTAQQALEIFAALNDQPGVNKARLYIATYHMALGNLTDAATLYEQIRQFWHEQHNSAEEVNALLSLSFVEQRRGDWFNTLQYLALAEPLINPQTDFAHMARLANSAAYVYNNNGLHATARTEYQRALDYSLKIEDNARLTYRMKMLIGYTYVLEQDYAAAATHLNDALTNLTLDLDIAQCREYLGQMHIGLQEYDIALQHLQAALVIFVHAKNLAEAARVQALIGQINEQQGALAPARKRYLNALQRFRKVEDRVNEAAVNFSLGKLELKVGNYDLAEKYLKGSLEKTEDLRRASVAHDLTTTYSATVYERYQTYIDCLIRKHELHPSQGLHIEAFQASELARARALAELLRDGEPSTGPHQTLAKREKALRQTIGERTGERIKLLSAVAHAKPEARDKLNAQLAQLEASINEVRREHAGIAEQLRKADSLFAQLQQPTAYSLEQIQQEVIDDEQTVLLEFMLGEVASYVWAVRKTGIKLYKLENDATINKAAEEFYDLVKIEPKGDADERLQKAAARLTELVIKPLSEELNAQRLIIVADGGLNYIPFQLLPEPSATNEPLVANHEIINAPSASILGQLRKLKQQRQPTTRLLAAFGDPVFPANYAEFKGTGNGELLAAVKPNPLEPWRRAARDIDAEHIDQPALEPLVFSKFELEKLRELGDPQSVIAQGFAASRENLVRLDLSQFSVLHIATHGFLDPKNPEITGFFLSMLDDSGQPQNGFITTPDVYALKAPVDLVVLSACRTGLGKEMRGEGLIGLTSGFMHAGASSVAATLWKVDDSATAELMNHFYTNMLEKKMRPAEALRAAQNTLRLDSRWQSPHFWAAFTLQGEYQNTIRIPQPTGASHIVRNVAGAILLLLLLGGIGWRFLRRRWPSPVGK
jgi:CHAT domain-containing protein